MSLLKLILKAAVPTPKLENYRKFLFVGPHPDDIEIGAGATAAKLAAMGKEICFVVCLDGRFGDGNSPDGIRGDRLVEVRREEAIASASMLGVTDVRFLNLCDGGFYTQMELVNQLAQVVGDFQPEVIVAPDPNVTSECHADHLNVGCAARQLACFAPYSGIMAGYGAESAPVQVLAYYMTAKPNHFVKTRGFLKQQLAAIFDCHRSQFPEGCSEAKSIALYLKLRSMDFGIRSGMGCAEGFRVLGPTHMHCFPEAGN
ncbi:MAG: PIG-L family deacetylase [Oscillospiraceae bacterium]|nr:PIG-L family deacetylase [Oscillospiraceae bacterium]